MKKEKIKNAKQKAYKSAHCGLKKKKERGLLNE